MKTPEMISCKYCGTAHDYSGYGDANRNFIAALFTAGVNTTTEIVRQVPEKSNYGLLEAISTSLQDRQIPYKVKIIHLTPDMYPRYKEPGVYNIGHLFWETSHLPEMWVAACNEMDEIWTASEPMIEMIKKSGVTVPVFSFPQPIYVQSAFEEIKPIQTQYEKDYTFYSIFQWIDRKNPRGLLRAYWQAFEGNNNVTLLLKTYGVNYSESEFDLIKTDIANWKKELGLKHYPKIFLVKKLLTAQEKDRIHAFGDCFVSSSSGEGWNRPMQEAMLRGNPVISGDNGGITDVMSGFYYYQVESKAVNCTESSRIPWYTREMQWRTLDEEKLIEAMKEVYANQDKAKKVGISAQAFVVKNFSLQSVGDMMKNRLTEIYRTL